MRSVAIIGAGQIGFAAAGSFLAAGWEVRILARTKPQWITSDMAFERHVLGEMPTPRADVVLDTIAFDANDVERFAPSEIGRYIGISSAAVYADSKGRGFETDPALGSADYGGPVSEDAPFVADNDDTYSSRKVRMEAAANAAFGERATMLRPCAIHGPYSRQPREWWYVKRLRDGRRKIPLAFSGKSLFHSTSARSIGDLALFVAERNLGGAFNIADEAPCDVHAIGTLIADLLETPCDFHLLEGPPKRTLGATPWSLPHPFTVSCNKAIAAGFTGIERYDASVPRKVEWLCDQPLEDWKPLFPSLAGYGWNCFDYETEDAFFDEQP